MKPPTPAQKAVHLQKLQRDALLRPNDILAAFELAEQLSVMHRTTEALRQFDVVLRLDPTHVRARLAKAEILNRIGEVQHAFEEYRLCVLHAPQSYEAQLQYARQLDRLKHFAQALQHALGALAIEPNFDAHFLCGQLQRTIRNYSQAFEHFAQALLLQPSSFAAKYSLAEVLVHAKEEAAALVHIDEMLSVDPTSKDALLLRALALAGQDRIDEAVAAYQYLLELNPRNAQANSNFCCLLFDLGRHQEAALMGMAAVQLSPDSARYYFNLANPLIGLERELEAIAALQKAIELEPTYNEAHAKLGQLYLKKLDFKNGWPEFAKLPRPTQFVVRTPEWDGRKLDGSLLLIGDQGVGDQILYSSMLHEVVARGIEATVLIDERLIAMMQRRFPSLQFLSKDAEVEFKAFAGYLYLTSLGLIFRPDVSSFGRCPSPYLVGNADRAQTFRAKLKPRAEKICGLSWSSKRQTWGKPKSFDIEALLPILALDGWVFVNLQYGDTDDEIATMRTNYGITIHAISELDCFNDLDGLAALISACDVVVSSSNTTAHVAGACGVDTALLLPRGVARIWYWQEQNGRSLWYPKTRIFSQAEIGDWSAPITQARDLLAGWPAS